MATPSEIGISERSMKFYDGTYSLVADGFVDEHGVYRAFDCYDPAARAPTPLPPGLIDKLGESRASAYRLRQQSQLQTSGAYQQGASLSPTRSTEGSSIKKDEFWFASNSASSASIKIPREDLILGHKDREHLLGKLEGIQLASRHMGTELSQAECYKLCGVEFPEEAHKRTPTKQENTEETTPDVISKVEAGDGASPLSDCPSDISDWEESNKARTSMKNKTPTKAKQVANDEITTKRTTRGVAQKGPRAKKKSGPMARQAQIPLEGVSSRRRSAR